MQVHKMNHLFRIPSPAKAIAHLAARSRTLNTDATGCWKLSLCQLKIIILKLLLFSNVLNIPVNFDDKGILHV